MGTFQLLSYNFQPFKQINFFPLRGECEELRATLSKQVRDEIFEDRDTQLTMQADQKEKEAQHEAFYADLWKSDMMAKAAREEQETKESIERNQATLEVI